MPRPRMVDPDSVKKLEVKPAIVLPPPADDNYWEIKDLPSRYKLYPEGTKISARPLRVLELKKLATIDDNNVLGIINDILTACTRGIDVKDILVSDKLYIIFWSRWNTFKDSGYQVPFTCPSCKKESDYHFNLDQLDTRYYEEDFEKKRVVELPVNKLVVTFKYQRIADEEIYTKFKMSKEGIDKDVLNVASQIKNIKQFDGNYIDIPNIEFLYNWVASLDAMDYTVLEHAVNETKFGIVPAIDVACNHCKETARIGLSFRAQFLFPKYRK